jgi:hypothetical protein
MRNTRDANAPRFRTIAKVGSQTPWQPGHRHRVRGTGHEEQADHGDVGADAQDAVGLEDKGRRCARHKSTIANPIVASAKRYAARWAERAWRESRSEPPSEHDHPEEHQSGQCHRDTAD